MSRNPVRISIIVPVYNNPRDLRECLAAVAASAGPGSEVIVVDDASTDEIRSVAAEMGANVLRLDKNLGPSSARNYGARHAHGDVLFFVDADLVVRPDAISRVLHVLESDPTVAAVFGSYDSTPRARGVVSQYRNLLHHYVHQQGNVEASTFWAGCGAIRRSVFKEIGGFDEKRFSRCIEDIELGYRLRQGGHRIVLDKALQGKHLKRWTLLSVIRTDVGCRAVPWTRLILERKTAPDDLNLKGGQRASVALVGLGCLFLLLAPLRLEALALAAAAFLAVIVLNRDLYTFFVRQRGLLFAAAAIPLHFLYYIYGGLTYGYVWLEFRLRNAAARHPWFKERRLD
jgi:glycosyltransferase involved in cell wall biosynthesis